MARIIAIIPCYNEERFIGDIVLKARKHVDQVIVVDDGSTDATAETAESAGAMVVSHEVNKGYGESISSCFKTARAENADILVILDGDGQHDPDEIPQLLPPLLGGEANLVIGSRFINKESRLPQNRKFGIIVINWLFNFGSTRKVSDAQSGFRAYSKEVVEVIAPTARGMEASVQVLIEARRKGFIIQEVPISCLYHPESHSLDPVSHGLGVALAVVKIRLKNFLLPSAKSRST